MTRERAIYEIPGQEVRREARLPFSDPDYSPPTPMEVRAVLRKAGWTGSQAALVVGVDGRTIRKWTGGEREIPRRASACHTSCAKVGRGARCRVRIAPRASQPRDTR